jgi:Zn-dependent peptidase ImmA (M78 family)
MHMFANLTAERDITHEANLVAAEFLMPEDDIRQDFAEPITLPRLAELKKKWKASMISLLYRADDLGFITANQKKYLVQQFNNQNIRSASPQTWMSLSNSRSCCAAGLQNTKPQRNIILHK